MDKVCEEKVVVKVTFPTQYHAEDLAGKEAEFHCTIHQIRVKTAYELDDGTPGYEIDFRHGNTEYDYTIHAKTGEILEWDKE